MPDCLFPRAHRWLAKSSPRGTLRPLELDENKRFSTIYCGSSAGRHRTAATGRDGQHQKTRALDRSRALAVGALLDSGRVSPAGLYGFDSRRLHPLQLYILHGLPRPAFHFIRVQLLNLPDKQVLENFWARGSKNTSSHQSVKQSKLLRRQRNWHPSRLRLDQISAHSRGSLTSYLSACN